MCSFLRKWASDHRGPFCGLVVGRPKSAHKEVASSLGQLNLIWNEGKKCWPSPFTVLPISARPRVGWPWDLLSDCGDHPPNGRWILVAADVLCSWGLGKIFIPTIAARYGDGSWLLCRPIGQVIGQPLFHLGM